MTIPTVHHAFVWEAEPRRYTATVSCEVALSLVHGGTATFRGMPTFFDAVEHERSQNLRAPYKPRADVIVLGHAHVPAQDPETDKILVRFRLGDYAKAVRVIGDRHWVRVDGRWTHDSPRKFRRMMLSPERSPRGPENPTGFDTQAFPAEHRLGMPNLEPVGSGFGAYLGPVPSTATIRTQSMHAVGAAWAMGFLQTPQRTPPPQGFDFGFFNIAPPDQQLRELPLGAAIVLEHLSPEHLLLTSRLPFVTVDAEIRDARGQDHTFPLACDTLWLDTEQSLVLLTFRGACAITSPGDLLRAAVIPGIREAAPTGGRSVDLQRTGIGALPQASTLPFVRPRDAAPNAPPKLKNATPFTNPNATADDPSTSESYPPPPKTKMNITQEIELEAPKLHAGLPFEADDEPSTGVRTSTAAPPAPKPTETIPPPPTMMDESSTPFEETVDRTPRTYRISPPTPPPSGTLRAHQVTHRRSEHAHGQISDPPTETTATDPGMVPAVIPFASPNIAKPRRKLEAPELPPTRWPPLPPAPQPATVVKPEEATSNELALSPPAPPPPVFDFADPVSQLGSMRLGGSALRSTSDPPEPSSRQLADEPTLEKSERASPVEIAKVRKTIVMKGTEPMPPKIDPQAMPKALPSEPPKLATPPLPPSPSEPSKLEAPRLSPTELPRTGARPSSMSQEESTVTGVAMMKHLAIEARTLDDIEAEADRDAFDFPLPPSDGFEVEGVTLEHCAAIRAHLAISGVDRDGVLSLHALDAAIWARIEREHLARLDGETSRGEFELLRRYDAAYVAAQDKVRQPIGVGEWAQIVRAKRDGNLGPVLAELGVARTELMRLERVWKLRAENHAEVRSLLEKLVAE